jgi:hypothetical protein
VPVLPNGKPDDRGILVLRAGGEWIETSIPLHLAFVRDRAKRHPQFRPLIRLTKWWAQECEVPVESFIVELLWAHLYRATPMPDDLQEALLVFFGFIVRSELRERIVFTDNYPGTQVPAFADPVRIVDPVNPANNVAASISETTRQQIITMSYAALDAVAAASSAPSRGRGVDYYRRVLGSRFAA